MTATPFGTTKNGEEVLAITIGDEKLTATILTWGAVLQDLRLDGVAYPLVLGLMEISDYEEKSPSFGAVCGRSANRLDKGHFEIDGVEHQLSTDPKNGHHLHGGLKTERFGERVWELKNHDETSVTLALTSPHDEAGYPGTVDAEVTYAIEEGGLLVFEATATTDAPTLINLAQHSYFNLDDATDIRGHSLEINAEHYLPVRDDLIPTGEIEAVARGMFDFRELCPMGTMDYDHNFCLSDEKMDIRPVATLRGASGVEMVMSTTEPGLQFYNGSKIDVDAVGLGERRYGPYSGVALEAQIWPDAPNHPDFPSTIVHPGETYHQRTTFRFTA